MYARLDMTISADQELSYQMASSFHGALMERISPDYADLLHESRLHPYTQHLERHADGWHWIVTTLDQQATEQIIDKALVPMTDLELTKHQIKVHVENKRYQELSERELTFSFYEGQSDRYITIAFLTPTAFKNNGRYQNYPDIRSIYSNLMNKYDVASDKESMRDEDTLDQLVENTNVFKYALRSTLFSIEGVRIPAFLGEMTFRIDGTQTMCNFANMLFRFGEYSGVGIKTALGMGAIGRVEGRRRNNGRQAD